MERKWLELFKKPSSRLSKHILVVALFCVYCFSECLSHVVLKYAVWVYIWCDLSICWYCVCTWVLFCSHALSIRDDRFYWSVFAILLTHTHKHTLLSLISATLRALYLSDNDFEILPPDIGKLAKLQIVSNLSKFPLKSIAFVAALCAVCVEFILRSVFFIRCGERWFRGWSSMQGHIYIKQLIITT